MVGSNFDEEIGRTATVSAVEVEALEQVKEYMENQSLGPCCLGSPLHKKFTSYMH